MSGVVYAYSSKVLFYLALPGPRVLTSLSMAKVFNVPLKASL